MQLKLDLQFLCACLEIYPLRSLPHSFHVYKSDLNIPTPENYHLNAHIFISGNTLTSGTHLGTFLK